METTTIIRLQERVAERPVRKTATRALIPAAWKRKTGRAANMIESFYHAFHGIWIGLKEERNVRIHFVSAFAVLILGDWLHVALMEWLALALSIGLVLTTEFLNTALERVVDLSAEGQFHEHARQAKDTAAAAVLCASVMAALVGAIVFVPKLLSLVHS